MQNLDFQPKMVGRENELKELQAYLDSAVKGQGSTVFISGEAGIGKTRLVNELKGIAQSKGFQILSGNSMYESLTPFMPIMEALRSGGLESLFAEESPKVEAIYLVTHSGLLIKEVVRQETMLDPDLFSSVLTTLSEFASQSLSTLLGKEKEGTINSVGYENYRILIESRKSMNLIVIISGKENEFLINDIRDIFSKVNWSFKDVLEDWDGDEENIKGIEKFLEPLIMSGKYDGIYYGKDDPKTRRNLLFENVSLGLVRQAQQTPTLLCIEDLQWADPSSLALIHYIARNTRKYGLLILGTYRPEDVAAVNGKSHFLVGTMELMGREDLYERMELVRLPKENMDEILSGLLGKIDFANEFKDRIYKETEGNPLFVIQLIKYMIDEKIILNDKGKWKLAKDLKDIEIPSKIYHLIERRLNRLKKEDRMVLDYASVIGGTFTSLVLTHALGMNRTQLLEQLRDLEQTHRLIHSDDGNFKFNHTKIKEVLYNEIPGELRRNYHSIIANSIEDMNKENLDDVIEDLALHYYQCKNKEKALFYLIKAAEKAKKDYSNEEAIRFYSEALYFEEDKKKRREIFEAMGDLYRLTGDFNKSIESYNSALELTVGKHKSAEIMGKIGYTYEKMGSYNETIRICTKALDLVKSEDCKEEANIYYLIGFAQMRQGDYDNALMNFEKCSKIGQKINDHESIAMASKGIGGINWSRGEHHKAVEMWEKSLKIWKEIDNPRGISQENLNIAFSLTQLGEYEKAFEYFKKAQTISEKMGDQESFPYISWGLAEIYYGKGDLKKALDFTKKAFEISKKINMREIVAEAYRIFGMIYGKQKKWGESIENFEESFKIFKEIGMKMELGENHFEFGLMWKVKGDVDKAKEHFQKALDIFNKLHIEKKADKVKIELEAL